MTIGKLLLRNTALILARDCEIWYEKGLIEAKDDIADYYLAQLNTVNPHI